jgi:hypothetical protein
VIFKVLQIKLIFQSSSFAFEGPEFRNKECEEGELFNGDGERGWSDLSVERKWCDYSQDSS